MTKGSGQCAMLRDSDQCERGSDQSEMGIEQKEEAITNGKCQ